MSNLQITKRITSVFFSFLFGMALMLMLGLTKDDHDEKQEILKSGEFGDIRIFVSKFPNLTEAGEVLIVAKKDYPFIAIKKNRSGIVDAVCLFDSSERELARMEFEKGKTSNLYLLDNKEGPVFVVEASEKPGVWQNARYMPCVKIDKPFKTYVDHMPVGEHYRDFDFDGHFDAKTVYNEHGDIISRFICVKDEWQEVCKYNFDELEGMSLFVNGKFQKITPDDSGYDSKLIERLSSLPPSERQIKYVYYDFEFGKGWKQREEKK